jgi:SWI/SNF-related matrix-associated actin-dependent regulator of chromatin subfamily A member 5
MALLLQGLGKTLQSITFLAHLKWVMDVPGPHLVVVPLSVMSSWMTELAR